MSESASLRPDELETLRAAYSRFLTASDPRVASGASRILLTGHSHQAWPDVVRDALLSFFDDSARLVDDKWAEAIFPRVRSVGAAILSRMGFAEDDPIAFGKSSHEVVFRLLSCLSPSRRPRIVTTLGEFNSLHRQLCRFAEEGAEVEWIDATPRDKIADRLLAALTPGTAMLAFSAVLFEDAYVVPRLGEIVAQAARVGAIPLVDAYHAFNVVPLSWGPSKDALFVTAGSYKYAGIGEGLCWLRIPRGCELRPLDTGWFAEFGALAESRDKPGSTSVGYGPGGARFAGASFDASSVYRAHAALAHWDRFGLTVPRLRAISLRQTKRIIDAIDAVNAGDRVVTSRDDARRGGFVAVRTEQAEAVVQRLRARGVWVDARADILRLGPAPYLTDDEIDRGTAMAIEELRKN